jgi:hypothetical protein
MLLSVDEIDRKQLEIAVVPGTTRLSQSKIQNPKWYDFGTIVKGKYMITKELRQELLMLSPESYRSRNTRSISLTNSKRSN